MGKSRRTSDAVEILHRRYVDGDPQQEAALEVERVNAAVARMVYDLRTNAGLTQKDLAKLVGTTQSAISRLEDSDYEGHSLSMLNRIATALNQTITVGMTGKDPATGTLRFVFQSLLQALRRERNLTVDELAARLGVDRSEVLSMERNCAYRPAPLTLRRLGRFYGIPAERLAALAGAVREVPEPIRESASRFAAKSESLGRITEEERGVVDEFVRFLKSEVKS